MIPFSGSALKKQPQPGQTLHEGTKKVTFVNVPDLNNPEDFSVQGSAGSNPGGEKSRQGHTQLHHFQLAKKRCPTRQELNQDFREGRITLNDYALDLGRIMRIETANKTWQESLAPTQPEK